MINDKGYINSDLLYESGSYNSGVGHVQYIKFSDGTLIQAGDYGQIILKALQTQNVTCKLEIPFIDGNYYVAVGKGADVSGSAYIFQNVSYKGTNSLVIFNYNANGSSSATLGSTNWVAIGKWK